MCSLVNIYQVIKLVFGVSGHTKFSPDGHFGKIKKKVKETNSWRIRKSALSNFELVYKGLVTLIKNFERLDWKAFLKSKVFNI